MRRPNNTGVFKNRLYICYEGFNTYFIISANIAVTDTSLNARCFGLHLCRRKVVCVTSTTFTQCAPKNTDIGEITQYTWLNKSHLKSPIVIPIESSYKIYNFLLVIYTNLTHILHRFQVVADYMSNFR